MTTNAPNNPADSSFIPHPSSLDGASQQPATSIVPPAPSDRKLSHPTSPVTQLKLLWRNEFTEEERDNWREVFASPVSNRDLRREILAAYQIDLRYDTQLIRFRRWADAYEERTEQIQAEAEAEAQATAALQSQGLTHDQIRSALLNRLQTRALVTGDFKLAARAINLDLRLERNLITQRRLDLQERRVIALERKTNRKPLTPEGLAKIEKDLHLFED